MPLTPVEFPRFGGLDFSVDPQEEGFIGAVDLMDVELDRPGVVRSRNGARQQATFTSGTALDMTYSTVPSQDVYTLAVASPNGLKLVGSNGSTLRSIATGVTHQNGWFTKYGTPSNSYLVYTADAITATYANTATTLTASYGGGPLGVTPWGDNRLVIGAVNGANDRVRFSVAGDPTTFNANDYVDLSPGDGEKITNVCAYRDLLFVFKQTKFFVFTGASVDASGNPVFNYRVVNTGHGARDYHGVAVTPEGVYFADDAGLWLTAGENPRKVSTKIDTLISNRYALVTNPQPAELPYTSAALMAMVTGRTFMKVCAASNYIVIALGGGMLAYHRPSQTWTAWSLSPVAMCGAGLGTRGATAPVTDGVQDLWFSPSGASTLWKMSQDYIDDSPGVAVGRWKSGFWTPVPGAEANVFEWLINGTTDQQFSLSIATNESTTATTSVVPVTTNDPRIGRVMSAAFGRSFSVQISGNQVWELHKLAANVSGQTSPGFQAV